MGETNASLVDVEPDAQIVEALKNKDRLYVLKLGEQMEALIKERRYVTRPRSFDCFFPSTVTRRRAVFPRGTTPTYAGYGICGTWEVGGLCG